MSSGLNAVAAGTVLPAASVIAASASTASAPPYTTPNAFASQPDIAMPIVTVPSDAATPHTHEQEHGRVEASRSRLTHHLDPRRRVPVVLTEHVAFDFAKVWVGAVARRRHRRDVRRQWPRFAAEDDTA